MTTNIVSNKCIPLFVGASNVSGFFGTSSIERLPTEVAIKAQVEDFKRIEI